MDGHDEPLFQTKNMALYQFLVEKGHSFCKWRNERGTETFWYRDSHMLRRHVRQFEALNASRDRAFGSTGAPVIKTLDELASALVGTA